MKYKSQSLSKIEKLEHQLRALEIDLNRGNSLNEIQVKVDTIKNLVQNLRDLISIEHDEWN